MSDRPAWRVLYDRVSDELSPRLRDTMASDGLAEAIEVAGAIGARAAAELQRTSVRVLHAWNLPAGSDITTLRHELGALTRELRTLARRIDQLQRELDISETGAAVSESVEVAASAPEEVG